MPVKEFLKPDRRKLGVAIAISLIFHNILFLKSYLSCALDKQCHIYVLFNSILLGELYSILLSFIIYPFACSIVAIYSSRKDLSRLKNKRLVIIGLIFFNPLVIPWLVAAILVLLLRVEWLLNP
jgi:nitrogen fixation/metabolism regulation signal transduction histidine kinase